MYLLGSLRLQRIQSCPQTRMTGTESRGKGRILSHQPQRTLDGRHRHRIPQRRQKARLRLGLRNTRRVQITLERIQCAGRGVVGTPVSPHTKPKVEPKATRLAAVHCRQRPRQTRGQFCRVK